VNVLTSDMICCVIVTYNPDGGLVRLVNIIEKQVDKVVIVDNYSGETGYEILLEIVDNNKVHLIRNNENYGIAKALNQGVQWAIEMKYRWVITFDQDSMPYKNIIETISEVYYLFPDKDKIGAIGTNYSNENFNDNYRKNDKEEYRIKDYLITSGCLISTDVFLKVGGFREDFFIDNVDLEYSLNLRKHGKISLITKKTGMDHNAGVPRVKSIFGVALVSSNHNRTRRYYMARNHVALSKEYLFKFPFFIVKMNYFFIGSIIKIIIIDDDKKAKINSTFKGLLDGFFHSSKNKIQF
jgi:rhamnosyltransferase